MLGSKWAQCFSMDPLRLTDSISTIAMNTKQSVLEHLMVTYFAIKDANYWQFATVYSPIKVTPPVDDINE